MTKSQRHAVHEALAIGAAGILGAFVIPDLVSERDSLAVLCGGLLFIGWLMWLTYFLIRMWRI